MSNIQQYTTFERLAINSDDSNLYMPKGSSPYNLNITIGEDGSQGVVTLMKGNLQITYDQALTLSNCYEVLGSYYNHLTRKCYFFLFSQPYLDTTPSPDEYLHDNRLLCFNEDSQTIDTIFIDTKNYFELDPAQHLTDIRMIGNWLFFNPVTAQPKMIDVVMAYNYTTYDAWDDTDVSASAQVGAIYTWQGGLFVANTDVSAGEDPSTSTAKWDRIGNSYQDFSTTTGSELSKAFFAIKVPPVDRLTFTYASDTTNNSNQVRGKVFRFCHRYQYFDDSYSVCSAHSDITRPIDNEVYNGDKAGSDSSNNYIQIYLSLYSAALVKNIEILFQEIGGVWKRMTVINRQDQSLLDTIDYTYNFYNNGSYPVIDQTIPSVIYDAVPRLASTQEIINKNILCFAGCTEGFDNTDTDLIDVTLTPEMVSIDLNYTEDTVRRDNVASNDITQSATYDDQYERWYYITTIDIGAWYSTVQDGDVYRAVMDGFESTLSLTASDVASASALATAIAGVLRNAVVVGDSVEITYNSNYPNITVSRIFLPTAVLSALTKKGTFKAGAYHPFCRFYYDEALRRGDAQTGEDMMVYIPSLNEYSPPVTDLAYRWKIGWSVSDAPPTWAKYWKWGYAGNRRCSSFTQYIVSSVADGSAEVANSVKIDITPLQTIRTTTTADWNCFPNSTITEYSFTAGDRIRFMTEATNPATATELGDIIDGIYDYEILLYDVDTNMVYVQTFDFTTPTIGINSLVEIYTPIKSTDALEDTATLTYYEFGSMMPIIRDAGGNLAHGGQIADQSISSPTAATGEFEYGDAYVILRTPSKPIGTASAALKIKGAFHESMSWSDFYESDDWDKGKLGLESPIGEKTLNIIRYSNVYLQNTAVNGITTFEAGNYKELNDTYGRIVSIVEVGDTLKCYQEKKAASIQIGRTSYYNADGESANVQTQSFILGTIRYSPNSYGTTFSESISKNNRYVYGFDAYQGVVWRDSPAGIFPISGRYADIGGSVDYKMASYFKSKAKALLSSGVDHCKVMTVWDEEYKMLYINFKDKVNETNNATVVFHEPSDKWITFTDQFEYQPSTSYNEILEVTYSVVKGFENGLGYVFDKESRFATFNIGEGVGTPDNLNIDTLGMAITITLPNPAIKIDCELTPTPFVPTLALGTPDIHLSWVTLSDYDFQWEGSESENLVGIQFLVESSEPYVEIMDKAAWVDFDSDIGLVGIGTLLPTPCNVWVYPNSANTGLLRTATFVFGKTQGYPDTQSITVTHLASTTDPYVWVAVDGRDTTEMTITEESGSVATGETTVNIAFTPSHPLYDTSADFTMYWQASWLEDFLVTAKGQGSFTVRNNYDNTKSITLTEGAPSAIQIDIFLASTNVF